MKKFKLKNLNIGWKYGFMLIIVFILFGISTTVVTTLVNEIGNDVDALERRGDRAIKVTEMGSLTRAKYIRVARYSQDPIQQYIDEYEERRESFNALEAEIREKMDTQEQLELFDQIVADDKKMNDLFTKDIVQAMDSGDTESVNRFVSQANEIQLKSVNLLDDLRTIVNEERALAITEVEESQQLTFIVLLSSMAISIIIGGLLVFFISRVVSRNLNEVVAVSNKIADGELSIQTIDYDGNDEIGQLATATNTMATNLRTIIQQVSEISETVSGQSEELTQSANEVRAGSQQVAVTMQELASGAESQANNSAELSSAMDIFSAKMQEANSNGEFVYESSNKVLGMTTEGGQLMETSVKQMAVIDQIVKEAVSKVQGLDTQSQEISKLVSVIKDIADQTNLLALNAAIEAARAGEHGQGFAVVADEVRKLAEQVSDSVTDISGIVTSIQQESAIVAGSLQDGYKEVEKGTNQMKTTGDTFTEINSAITEMVSNIQNITNNLSIMSANSQEMGATIEEIASVSEESAAGVEQTSASTQQTSSSMEEVANSSEELSKLAEELNGLVRNFKL
jgi:methyl-accepting chemotaxis protein